MMIDIDISDILHLDMESMTRYLNNLPDDVINAVCIDGSVKTTKTRLMVTWGVSRINSRYNSPILANQIMPIGVYPDKSEVKKLMDVSLKNTFFSVRGEYTHHEVSKSGTEVKCYYRRGGCM
jgi:hypothetical protein